MPFHGERFEDSREMFPNMEKFVDQVIRAYKPPHPHLLCVQGFQLAPRTDKYYLTEMTYRQLGQRDTMLSYMYSGVSQETALLMCHLDPQYRADPDPARPKVFERHLWFPYNEGVLRSHRKVPSDAPITSELTFNWLVEPGTQLCKPTSFAHFMLHIRLQNANRQKVLADLRWLEENWRPDILPLKKEEEEVVEKPVVVESLASKLEKIELDVQDFDEIEDPETERLQR